MFLEKLRKTREEGKGVLCVGLDPSPNGVREGKEIADIADFCESIVEKTSGHAAAFKPNLSYVLPLGLEGMKRLNKKIHAEGCVSILDWKAGDIGSTNDAAMHWTAKAGFDAVTFSPFAGNIAEATGQAHARELGIIVLALMSNPEARFFMRESTVGGKPGFEWIAGEIAANGADGAVVGATKAEEEIAEIRRLLGSEKMILIPGVGAQGGDAEAALKAAGENSLVNVGRAVFNDANPGEKAREYADQFKSYLAKYSKQVHSKRENR